MNSNLSTGMVSFGDKDLKVGAPRFHGSVPESHIVSGNHLSTQVPSSSFQFMNMDVKSQHSENNGEISGSSSNRESGTAVNVWQSIPTPNTPTRNDAASSSFGPAPSASISQQSQPSLVPGYNRRNTTSGPGGPVAHKAQNSQSLLAHRRSLQTMLHNDNGSLWANGKTTPVKEDQMTMQGGKTIFFGPEFGSGSPEFLDPLVTAGSPWNDTVPSFAAAGNIMTPSLVSRTSRFFPSPISDQRKDFFQGGLSGTASGVFPDSLGCSATSSVRPISDEVNLDLNLGIIDTEPFKAQHFIDKLSRFRITSVSEYLLSEHSDLRLVTQSQNEWEDEEDEYDDEWETVPGSLDSASAVDEFSNLIVSLPPRGLGASATSSISSLSSSGNSDTCMDNGLESLDVTSYIKKIITRQQETHVTYIASLSHSAKPQFEKLIHQVFRNYGDILRIEDEPSTNNDFVKFKVFTKLHNGKGPYKIFKFINERTQREEKMLFFFESNGGGAQNSGYGVSAGSNSSAGSAPSKNDVNTYPEGFSSTFHKRGINNFMFVRELQSKMIVNKSAKTNSEYGEFRISMPVHRVFGGTKFTKKSFIINIDLREYESKSYNNDKAKHFKGKFGGR